MHDRPAAPDQLRNPSVLDRVRALRIEHAGLTDDEVTRRLLDIEHALQRSVSVAEAARIAEEKPATIYKAIARGSLTSTTDSASNAHRLSLGEVEAWSRRPRRAPRRPSPQD